MTSGIWNSRVLSQNKHCRRILCVIFSTECGTFSVRSPVIFCYVILPLSHICPLFHTAETAWDICCWCSVFTTTTRHLLQTTRNQVLTPYSQLSIVRYSPNHRERLPASRKFLWRLYQAQNVTVNFVWEVNEGLVPDASVIGQVSWEEKQFNIITPISVIRD